MYVFETQFWLNHPVIFVFAIAIVIHNLYYLVFFSALAFFKQKQTKTTFSEPVSVIICAKNEDENLLKNLPAVLSQKYPNFEVIVVNDQSTDTTEDVLKAFSLQYKNLKIVKTPPNDDRFYFSKKMAVTLGIKSATFDYLVFTDADCCPASGNWLQEMVRPFAENHKKLVLGYSPYAKENGLLNLLIRFDTWMIGLQYLSFALRKMPYMGVGRNMAYKKELFFKNKGFANHLHLPSGDDDLFVQEVATGKNTAVVPVKDAHTISQPKHTFKALIYQKIRHLQTSAEYKIGSQLLIGLFSVNLIILIALFPYLVITEPYIYLILGLIGSKYLIQILIFSLANKYLNDKQILWTFWLLEPLLILFYFYLFAFKLIRKIRGWV